MAYKHLERLSNPQLWISDARKGLVEVVIIDNFGEGPKWYRMWVPENSYDRLFSAIKKRMAADHSIGIDLYTRLMSRTNPLPALLGETHA